MITYRRADDGLTMVEVAPWQFVNRVTAVALGLIGHGDAVAPMLKRELRSREEGNDGHQS